jgi:diacylglycerol kinase
VIVVTACGFYFHISAWEWCVLSICFALVICAELLNTAIERLCDAVKPERSDEIKFVKDASAGAVLFASVVAAIAGLIVFWPYLKRLFS